VEPGIDACAGDLVPGGRRRGDRHRFEPLDLADQRPPVAINRLDALARTARRRDELEAVVAGDGRHVLVGGNLAVTDDGNADRLHRRFTAAT
jgi:hypothetical protein